MYGENRDTAGRSGADGPDGGAGGPGSGSSFSDLPSADTTRTFAPIGREERVEPEIEAPEERSLTGLPPDTALLVVKRGPNAGRRFLLDQPVTTAGRHPRSDIFLDDVTVSRRHAEFRRDGQRFTVHDVGSLNGTYVNRELIENAALSGGDEVQIGKFRMVFLVGHRPSGQSVDGQDGEGTAR